MPSALPDLSACRSALIIKPSSLGDIVHTLPSVHLLKRRFPNLAFTWLVNPAFASLLGGNPDLAGTLTFPRENFRGAAGLLRFRRWLKNLPSVIRPDAALDFQGLLRSGLIARASQAPVCIGFSDSREGARWFHRTVIPVDPNAHAIERSLTLPRALGADGLLEFPLPEGSAPAALPDGTVPPGAVLLHPFSRGKGKSLSAGQVVRLCQELAPLPVLIAGRADTGTAALPGLPPNAISLLNATTLPELIWLIRRARSVISVDSGPMHIAAALTPNVLSLHTWSDPRKVGPWHPGTTVWKAGRLMRSGELDPEVCGQDALFPDNAVPTVAAWAHQTAR
ncbi:MAG: lipopolysaccharide heptosyltransferase family protein [Verrucomicrobiaceae bacterium]|nr:MAG: lipopolysaccharide heptosyltransferase family protein [Verrucomicrobiaceae bacterium]